MKLPIKINAENMRPKWFSGVTYHLTIRESTEIHLLLNSAFWFSASNEGAEYWYEVRNRIESHTKEQEYVFPYETAMELLDKSFLWASTREEVRYWMHVYYGFQRI